MKQKYMDFTEAEKKKYNSWNSNINIWNYTGSLETDKNAFLKVENVKNENKDR